MRTSPILDTAPLHGRKKKRQAEDPTGREESQSPLRNSSTEVCQPGSCASGERACFAGESWGWRGGGWTRCGNCSRWHNAVQQYGVGARRCDRFLRSGSPPAVTSGSRHERTGGWTWKGVTCTAWPSRFGCAMRAAAGEWGASERAIELVGLM